MTSINTNTDFSNYDKFMEAAKQGQEGLDKIHDYILTQNDELNQFTADITDAVWDESFPDVRTDLLIQDIHKLRVENESLKKTCLKWQEKADFNLTDSDEEEVNVKGTITLTSDTEPYEEMIIKFNNMITKEQYEDR